MLILEYIASIALLLLGGLLAVVNAWILAGQLRGKHTPSATPLIGGVFLFLGALLLPGGNIRPWAWLGLFIDYGCVPYLVMASFSLWLESVRYSDKKRILCLEYDAEFSQGTISVFPNAECIYRWKMKDGNSYGSMIMKVQDYANGCRLQLSLQDLSVCLAKNEDKWSLLSESGWHDRRLSLMNGQISERPLTRRYSGRADARC